MLTVREWKGMTQTEKDSYLIKLFLRTWKWKLRIMTRKYSTRFPFGGDIDIGGEWD